MIFECCLRVFCTMNAVWCLWISGCKAEHGDSKIGQVAAATERSPLADSLRGRVTRVLKTRVVTRDDVDSIVSAFATNENLTRGPFPENEADDKLFYRFIDFMGRQVRSDSLVVLMIIKLSYIVWTNAEYGGALTELVPSSILANVEVFLSAFRALSPLEEEYIIGVMNDFNSDENSKFISELTRLETSSHRDEAVYLLQHINKR